MIVPNVEAVEFRLAQWHEPLSFCADVQRLGVAAHKGD
jgi:hypothetical protein